MKQDIKESVVREALDSLDWDTLHTHLLELSFTSDVVSAICGHIRRHSDLICKYPNPTFERRRNSFFEHLRAFIKTNIGVSSERELLDEIELIDLIEGGYRGILQFLSKCTISQRPAPVRVSASIDRACSEYMEMKRRHDVALSKASQINATTGILLEDDNGNSISPDAILEGLSVTLAMTLIMEAYRNNWFEQDIVVLPSLPSVGDEECYEAGSTYLLASCWSQWNRVEKRRRFLNGELLEHSGRKRPKDLPEQITCLIEYRPLERGLSEREVYDYIANVRLKDRLIQTFFEIEIEAGMSEHTVGIENGATLPPNEIVSTEEYHTCDSLRELLGYSVFDDTERPGGLRLLEWVRGYIVLKEIVKKRINTEDVSEDQYAALLSKEELLGTLQACGLTPESAKCFVANTCLHKLNRDLFDCPIIRVGQSDYLIFGPAVIDLNISLAILSNLSSRGAVLGRKGKAFEQAVHNVFRKQGIQVCSFRAFRGDQEFEYDAVVPWGDRLFIFECKNHSLSSNDPAGVYYFDLKVTSQTNQITRLVKALEEYPDIIEEHIGKSYVGNSIVPCVLHSLPYARIGDMDGVYFIDFSILVRFFDQPYLRVKVPYRIGDTTLLHRTAVQKFWEGEEPSAEDFLRQLECPFQLELIMKHLDLAGKSFPVSEQWLVGTYELYRAEMTAKSVSEALGADTDYVLREIAAVSEQVERVRDRMKNE